MPQVEVRTVFPSRAVEGGRVTLTGTGLRRGADIPEVLVRRTRARVVLAQNERLSFLIPPGIAESGPAAVTVNGEDAAVVDLAAAVATGLHQVDSPVVDRDGNVYLTYSGTRGQQVPVSIFRVGRNGTRETYASGIVNPTSMAFDSEGRLYVSSRFEGVIYRLAADGSAEPFATDLGVACGLAFASDGTLFVGDRSGTIFSVDSNGKATTFAALPASVAAFHLALGSAALYVSAPTLSTYDPIYRITFDGAVHALAPRFGRPQGLAVGPDGALHVVEALAGASGLYRLAEDGVAPEQVLAGPGLVGVTFDHAGGLIVCSNDTAYRLANES